MKIYSWPGLTWPGGRKDDETSSVTEPLVWWLCVCCANSWPVLRKGRQEGKRTKPHSDGEGGLKVCLILIVFEERRLSGVVLCVPDGRGRQARAL